MAKDLIFSVSALNTYTKCAKKFDYQYIQGIKPPEEDRTAPQILGSTFHEGIEAALLAALEEGATVQTCLIAALVAAQSYARENVIAPDVLDDACNMLGYYLPILGIGERIKPKLLNGKPMIEFGFQTTFKNGVTLRGYIDAVVELSDGRTAMLDWKTRANPSNFYSAYALQLDRQLLVYAGVLKYAYGIAVDTISQVQMSSTLPSVPVLKKDCTGKSASDYSLRLGKTTMKVLEASFAHLYEPERVKAMAMFIDKVVGDDEFIVSTRVYPENIESILAIELKRAQAIRSQTEFLPILDAYICKGCYFLKNCRETYLVKN